MDSCVDGYSASLVEDLRKTAAKRPDDATRALLDEAASHIERLVKRLDRRLKELGHANAAIERILKPLERSHHAGSLSQTV